MRLNLLQSTKFDEELMQVQDDSHYILPPPQQSARRHFPALVTMLSSKWEKMKKNSTGHVADNGSDREHIGSGAAGSYGNDGFHAIVNAFKPEHNHEEIML